MADPKKIKSTSGRKTTEGAAVGYSAPNEESEGGSSSELLTAIPNSIVLNPFASSVDEAKRHHSSGAWVGRVMVSFEVETADGTAYTNDVNVLGGSGSTPRFPREIPEMPEPTPPEPEPQENYLWGIALYQYESRFYPVGGYGPSSLSSQLVGGLSLSFSNDSTVTNPALTKSLVPASLGTFCFSESELEGLNLDSVVFAKLEGDSELFEEPSTSQPGTGASEGYVEELSEGIVPLIIETYFNQADDNGDYSIDMGRYKELVALVAKNGGVLVNQPLVSS
jgi:hypothetical protein